MYEVTISTTKSHLVEHFNLKVGEKLPDNQPIGMFKSGAKLYRGKVNGTYRVSGYAQDGSDVIKAIAELFHLKGAIK